MFSFPKEDIEQLMDSEGYIPVPLLLEYIKKREEKRYLLFNTLCMPFFKFFFLKFFVFFIFSNSFIFFCFHSFSLSIEFMVLLSCFLPIDFFFTLILASGHSSLNLSKMTRFFSFSSFL